MITGIPGGANQDGELGGWLACVAVDHW